MTAGWWAVYSPFYIRGRLCGKEFNLHLSLYFPCEPSPQSSSVWLRTGPLTSDRLRFSPSGPNNVFREAEKYARSLPSRFHCANSQDTAGPRAGGRDVWTWRWEPLNCGAETSAVIETLKRPAQFCWLLAPSRKADCSVLREERFAVCSGKDGAVAAAFKTRLTAARTLERRQTFRSPAHQTRKEH